ncbi:MAG: PHP domain-containing protein [Fastidiosipilaceae bacterium]
MTDQQAVGTLHERILMGGADLHMHSTISDGTSPPDRLADEVCAAGLVTVSLTDHDSLAGTSIMNQRLRELSVNGVKTPLLIPGIELSVEGYQRELHLLAYYPYAEETKLQPYIDRQLKSRRRRNAQLCAKLGHLGYEITPAELRMEAKDGNAGRPHAARILVRKGYFTSVQQAFDQLLADDQAGYVPRHNPSLMEALEEIKRTGGVSVLAHPANYGWLRCPDTLLWRLSEMKEQGLAGVETIHGETSLKDSAIIAEAADKLGLLKTVGSDYHGENKINVRLLNGTQDFSRYLG